MKFMFFNKKSLERYFIENHKLHLSRLFCCNHTCYCASMVYVTSASRYITSALSPALSKKILDVHQWSDSTEFCGICRGSSDWCIAATSKGSDEHVQPYSVPGNNRPSSETPLKRCFDGGAIAARL